MSYLKTLRERTLQTLQQQAKSKPRVFWLRRTQATPDSPTAAHPLASPGTRTTSLRRSLNKRQPQHSTSFGRCNGQRRIQIKRLLVSGTKSGIVQKARPLFPEAEELLYFDLLNFLSGVERRYRSVYADLDESSKGWISASDIEKYATVHTLGLVPQLPIYYQTSQYSAIQKRATQVFSLLCLDAASDVVTREQFFAVCAVYDTYERGPSLDLFNKRVIDRLAIRLTDTRNMYYSFTIQTDWEALLKTSCTHEKVWQACEVVNQQLLTFEWFCRCLPFFSYVQRTVLHGANN